MTILHIMYAFTTTSFTDSGYLLKYTADFFRCRILLRTTQ